MLTIREAFERVQPLLTYVSDAMDPRDVERFLVVFAATYSDGDLVTVGNDEETVDLERKAAAAALRLTTDEGSPDTQWFVVDRETGDWTMFEQRDFDWLDVR